MNTVERQLITIVAEAVVERRIVDDIKKCGAKGYSLSHVTGEGVTGRHTLDLNGPSVRIESVVTDEIASQILEMLARDYFERFAVIAWLTPARVARPERF
ncbi:MAG: P-II family nitrogen regulator [Ilumatobacteraceae bacterium]